jgi:heat-inducible transcriptional repressor
VTVLDDRKLEVLRAIVTDFVSSNEPVGSRALAERHGLGVSPATVRNDMAALEDEGYITHPHTSAGRIPTDKGYRLFVDRLSAVKPLSGAERRAIQSFLEGAVDLDDVVRRTVRLLAQLTHQVAVVQYPSLSRSAVRHLEIVHLAPNRLLLVLITDTGRVEQRVLELPSVLSEDDVAGLRQAFGTRLHGARRAVRPARRRSRRDPAGAHEHHGRRPGDTGGEAGGADRARGHRQPHPARPRLPPHAAPRPRVARGAGGAAQAHG